MNSYIYRITSKPYASFMDEIPYEGGLFDYIFFRIVSEDDFDIRILVHATDFSLAMDLAQEMVDASIPEDYLYPEIFYKLSLFIYEI